MRNLEWLAWNGLPKIVPLSVVNVDLMNGENKVSLANLCEVIGKFCLEISCALAWSSPVVSGGYLAKAKAPRFHEKFAQKRSRNLGSASGRPAGTRESRRNQTPFVTRFIVEIDHS